jgi:PPOX class probable F420-dependent enzyme
MDSDLASLPIWAAELLERSPVGHLGLLDEDDHPRVQPITFVSDGVRVWTAIDHKPKRVSPDRLARVRRLRRDPRAALTVDRYDDDWSRLAWVQLLGEIEVLDAPHAPDAVAALIAKYPAYVETPPRGPILALTPRRCLYWRASSRSESDPDRVT